MHTSTHPHTYPTTPNPPPPTPHAQGITCDTGPRLKPTTVRYDGSLGSTAGERIPTQMAKP
jgi:hypothetical protein